MAYTLGEIANQIGATLHGNPEHRIYNVATLEKATGRDLSFFSNRRYMKALKQTRAGAVILKQEDLPACNVIALTVEDPYLAFARVSRLLHPLPDVSPGIHPTASIDESAEVHPSAWIGAHVDIGADARIGENVSVAAGCSIGRQVVIGNGTRFMANVTVYHEVTIGSHCLVHAGVVIGADGFGIANDRGKWIKIPQTGSVIIGDDVELGANTTIDRGALDNTVIGNGVKIDNQVQIGHNVQIGDDTAIAGCVAIAGSTCIGERCMIGGACGISGHIDICDDVILMAMTGVANSIREPGVYASGLPAMDVKLWRKNVVTFKQLYAMNTRIRKIEDNKDKQQDD